MNNDAIARFRKSSAYLENLRIAVTPWFRVVIRLLALPYWFIFRVNRSVCRIGNWQILKDFAYIVFVLRYFPDNYYPTRLWEKNRNEWAYYYGSILNPFQRAALIREVSRIEYHVLAKDKEVTWRICEALELPHVKTLAVLGPADNFRAVIRRLVEENNNSTLIIKPALGAGGEDIKLVFWKDHQIQVRNYDQVYPLEELTIEQRYIVQPYLQQHEDLNVLFPYAVNTIRAITVYDRTQSESLLLGANLRSGTRKIYVDNMHQGGISIGIDPDTGRLTERAMDYGAKIHVNHPVTGIHIPGFQVPLWKESRNLILETQERFNKLRLLAHDIAITPQGPRIIELNHQPCMKGFEQACGPILKNRETWKFFREHKLLINQPSRRLFPS